MLRNSPGAAGPVRTRPGCRLIPGVAAGVKKIPGPDGRDTILFLQSSTKPMSVKPLNGFRFSIDRGGTFTDVYAEVPGEPGFRIVKLLSEDPDNYEDAPREGIRRILEEVLGRPVSPDRVAEECIDWIRMGTTVATNALLERKGAPCALLVTRGFRDILRIGYQDRPDLFDLEIRRPEILHREVVEVDERIRLLRPDEDQGDAQVVRGVTGDRFLILRPIDLAALRGELETIRARGITSVAIVFMHGYAWPGHEQAAGRLAREMGFDQVSLSSEVIPMIRIVARGDTTLVDAYLNPHIRSYLSGFRKRFSNRLQGTSLLFMQSDGGLTDAGRFSGSRAILSGPAGGVVGYASTAFDPHDPRPVIGFDMGGTSTDVSRFAGDYELRLENRTAGVRIRAPQLDIRTVAAGGGSRLFFTNSMFVVGPESAGAHPGPVCYRKNGHLAITDANLVLGRIQADFFPRIFGPGEDQPLDLEAARQAMAALAETINTCYRKKGRPPLTVEEVAQGFIDVANEVMVRPIREISVQRGFDIKEHVLATFGGAGPQHCCGIARRLGIRTIFIHRFSGILSAYGIGRADVVSERQQPASLTLSPGNLDRIRTDLDRLVTLTRQELRDQGFAEGAICTRRYLNLRYQGTDTALMIAEPGDRDFAGAFCRAYRREFGFTLQDREILVDDLRVRSVGRSSGLQRRRPPAAGRDAGAALLGTRDCHLDGRWHETPVYRLDALPLFHEIPGPAILIQDTTTILVEPRCTARITEYGDVRITVEPETGQRAPSTRVDPVQLAIFSNLFMSIAEQMGRMLEKTAISTNIKERRDFSCALFNAAGDLVANAPHVPIHLGSMGEAVREQIRRRGDDIRPGDVLLSNHPAAGGSHLPDMTVITPVFRNDDIIFWLASRGHHADIGGISPGSMPPNSKELAEEGACIESCTLVRDGIFREEAVLELLLAPGRTRTGPGRPASSPSRRPADNLSDLRAQVAANTKGVELVLEMVEHYGLDVVQAYMQHVQDAAEEAVRERLVFLSRERGLAAVDTIRARDFMDDGTEIRLALTIDRERRSAVFDFTGTGPETWGNCNAPRAVTRSAVLYCLRCLIKSELPLNDGCLRPVRIRIPEGSLLSPSPTAAVVGGNVLTSQRIVDVVLRAFGMAAASQGCMNNLTFGAETFGYYETIGGGAGAGPTWHGQSGVHTHMTNTRITDPEVLEQRFPVLLREFSIRRGSGGAGQYRGGDGLVREIEFLEPLQVSILSERRVFAPYGLAGGEPGARGRNTIIRRDGRHISLGAKNEIRTSAGDRIRIETPGGGGFGPVTGSGADHLAQHVEEEKLAGDKEDDRHDGGRGHGEEPGAEDGGDDASVDAAEPAGQADPQDGADQGMGGGYGQ